MLKVTVITVCYNEKEKLKETIESVCNQTYSNIEYLIIDGASEDGTGDLLKEYSGCGHIYTYSETDHGIYNAMNRGIARATGDYVIFLNAGDTFYNESVICEAVLYMEDTDEIYYGKTCMIHANHAKEIIDFTKQEGRLEDKLFEGKMPCHQSIFAPRKLLVNHYFREEFQIRADYEWLLYCVHKGTKCKSIPIIISYFDATGVSSRTKNYNLLEHEGTLIRNEYFFQEKDRMSASYENELAKWKQLSKKNFSLFRLIAFWMGLKQKNKNIGEYMLKKGYHTISIYGMSFMGQILLNELNTCGLEVKYGIDQRAREQELEIPVYLPTDELEKVDAVIVTAVMNFYEIKGILTKKIDFEILSLEDILYEMEEEQD